MESSASTCDKFCLLMWKNWLMSWRHKKQLVFELLVPVVFSMVLVLLRSIVDPDVKPDATRFAAYPINDLSALRAINPVNMQYQLAYTPNHAGLAQMLDGVATTLQLEPAVAFADNQQLRIALTQTLYLAVIEFADAPEYHANDSNSLPRVLDYALRFPGALRTGFDSDNWCTQRLFPVMQSQELRNPDDDGGGIPPGYAQEGFLSIQNTIAQEFIRRHSGGAQLMPEVILHRYPYPPYRSDTLLMGLELFMPLIIVLSLIYYCMNIVKFIAVEKELQLKEIMKIMGLPNWLHWSSWFMRSMVLMTISSSLMVILLKVRWYPGAAVSVFNYSSWSAIWFFFFVFNIVSCAFCFMLSVFFTKASVAVAVSGLLWFLSFVPFLVASGSYDEMQLYTKLLYCLLSNTGMAFGFKIIIRFEGTSEGLQWSNLFKSVSVDDTLTVGYVMVMLLVDACVYFLITLYVEKVYPGEYGMAERWYFPFTRAFWCSTRSNNGEDSSEDFSQSEQSPKNFEPEPKNSPVGVQMRGLRKMYANKTVAVESLSLNMYKDQITVLLGHNGAGKSTTMAMLSGMLPPTSGTAIVNGIDICADMASVRNSLGLCPQHNILFDELTVEEHLKFFSRLKGMHKQSVKAEIEKYLRLIQLEDKRHAFSSQLSGGMKRKLSVCAAFCGGSKVVLCDEPTSGMDPSARRALWDVLKEEKTGRTVLLSTHFMDEAEILGDRIAIMSDGVVRACGSSYFLKKRFGVGYHLVCVKRATCRPAMVTALLQHYVSDVKIEHDIGTELSYQLAESKSNLFPAMFNDLEQNLENLGLESFGISMSTLEEVFLAIGTGTVKESIEDFSNSSTDDETYTNNRCKTCGYQIAALFVKKYLQTRRHWLVLLIQICILAMFVFFAVLQIRNDSSLDDLPSRSISIDDYEETVTMLQVDSNTNEIGNQFKAMFVNKGNHRLTVIGSSIDDYILDVSNALVVVNRAYMVGATIAANSNPITAWFNNQPYHTAPLAVNLVHNAVLRARMGENYGIRVANFPMPFTTKVKRNLNKKGGVGSELAMDVSMAMAFVAALFVLTYIRERISGAKLLQMISGASVYAYWLTAFVWDFATLLLTSLVALAVLAIFQEDGWSSPLELGRALLVLMLFAWAVLPCTYLAVRMFSVPATGFTRLAMLYIFTGMVLFIVAITNNKDKYKQWFLWFPHFAVANALNNIGIHVQNEQLCRSQCREMENCTNAQLMCSLVPTCCPQSFFAFAEPGIGRDMVYMVLVGFLAFGVLLMIEYRLISFKSLCCQGSHKGDTSDEQVDEDVQEERRRVQKMSRSDIDTHRLVLKNVSKTYKRMLAVNRLSVAINAYECFGLLGVNGAGKTSTFKMLTGAAKISSGEAWLMGTSLRRNMHGVYKLFGYCPQFDALIDELTGRETLRLFCRLRGVPEQRINRTICEQATQLNFVQHLDKQVRMYSGGTKRKLSTAVALLGNPLVVYLDEPTTGMDPGAKRCLWNVITKMREAGTAIVLTTHSMDECEALCTRMAIMVNGEFKCLGSVQHLKGKFSNGFTLNVRTANIPNRSNKSQDQMPLQKYIQKQFNGASFVGEYCGIRTYHLPRSAQTSWSRMFAVMEHAKGQFHLVDYSLHQVSLEQVFLFFAPHQRDGGA